MHVAPTQVLEGGVDDECCMKRGSQKTSGDWSNRQSSTRLHIRSSQVVLQPMSER